jgi:hypothetical protein
VGLGVRVKDINNLARELCFKKLIFKIVPNVDWNDKRWEAIQNKIMISKLKVSQGIHHSILFFIYGYFIVLVVFHQLLLRALLPVWVGVVQFSKHSIPKQFSVNSNMTTLYIVLSIALPYTWPSHNSQPFEQDILTWHCVKLTTLLPLPRMPTLQLLTCPFVDKSRTMLLAT